MPVKWNDVSSLMLHHVDNVLAVKYRTQKRHVDEWLAVSTISKWAFLAYFCDFFFLVVFADEANP